MTMREITTVPANVRQTADMNDALWALDQGLAHRIGWMLHGAVHDATRPIFSDGSLGCCPLIEKIVYPAVRGVAYATSELPTGVAPALILWQRKKTETGSPALSRLAEAWRATSPDSYSTDPALAALQASHRVALALEVDVLRDDLHTHLQLAANISQTLRDEAVA